MNQCQERYGDDDRKPGEKTLVKEIWNSGVKDGGRF